MSCVVALDESGTGALAGPIVMVAFTCDDWLFTALGELGVQDSKTSSYAQRHELAAAFAVLRAAGHCQWWTGTVLPECIDARGMWNAWDDLATSLVARVRSDVQVDRLVIDGTRPVPGHDEVPQQYLVRGETADLRIAAASILAKAHLDGHWRDVDIQHPGWDFARHAGGASPHHVRMLRQHGPLAGIHRETPLRTYFSRARKDVDAPLP